jgi:hypothetical protein
MMFFFWSMHADPLFSGRHYYQSNTGAIKNKREFNAVREAFAAVFPDFGIASCISGNVPPDSRRASARGC